MFYDVALPRIKGYDDPPTSDPMVASLHEKSELQRNWHEYADGTIACVLPRANLEISGKRVGKYNNSLPTLRGETSLHKADHGNIEILEIGQEVNGGEENYETIYIVGFSGLFTGSLAQAENMLFLPKIPGKRFVGIFPQAPGHGRTYSAKGRTIGQYSQDIKELLEMRGARKVITFGSSMGGAHALYLAKDLGSVCIGAIPDNPVIESMRARDFLKRAPYFARDALKMDAKNVFKQKLSPELGLDKLQLAVRIREIGHLMKYLGTVDPKEIADLANPIIVFMGKLDKVLPTLSLFRNHFEKYETGEKKSLTPFGDNVAVGLKGGVRYPGHSWGANNLMDYFSSNIRAILKFVEMDELKEHQKIPIATPMVMQAVSV